ncbi:hypothetical protein CLU79DRAFT_800131 [Phycomyces nitens]|nr:hypothetical protein CLU79DRAFT_800131 [Phycomyces nitens]
MKWKGLLVSVIVSAFIWAVPINSIETKSLEELELVQDFRVPKNIAFSCFSGGSSHVNWVMLIMDELAERGHNSIYITRDDHARFGESYPRIKSISIGKGLIKEWIPNIPGKRGNWLETSKLIHGPLRSETEKEVKFYRSYYAENKIDVAVCDMFATVCALAAHEMNIPFIITSSLSAFQDSNAPYINNALNNIEDYVTLHQSFYKRFYTTVILPFYAKYHSKKMSREFIQKLNDVGLTWFNGNEAELWGKSLKLVNTVFGFEPARPLGPLVEFVGPIIPYKHSPLTNSLEYYLNSHKRVVYIAFGQHAFIDSHDAELILTAMLECVEQGVLDGVIWATVHSMNHFPALVKTSRNNTYKGSDILENKVSFIRLLKWAPQYAILQHPSVIMFLTHGGAGSLHEALFAGKRLVVYPFSGDQPGTALNVERSNLGAILDYKKSQSNANKVIECVARDLGKKLQINVNRYKALVQIHAKTGPRRGADLVEEVGFMSMNGALPHRYEISRNMSVVKAYNMDVHAAWVSIVLGCAVLSCFCIKRVVSSIVQNLKDAQKLKTI